VKNLPKALIKRVVLFGSLANGSERLDSDIDPHFPYQTVDIADFDDRMASKARVSFIGWASWRNPMGEKTQNALKLHFDRRLRLEFHGTRITLDAGLRDGY